MRKKSRGKILLSFLLVISLLNPLGMTQNVYAKDSNATKNFDVGKLQQGSTEESTEGSVEKVPQEPQQKSEAFSHTKEEIEADAAGAQGEQEAAEDEKPEGKAEDKEHTQGTDDKVRAASANLADYFVFNPGTQTITAYSADSAAPKDIVIPEQIAGVDVRYIGTGAFQGQQLSSVTFQTTKLLGIGAHAFENNKNLSGVLAIPASVRSIGEYAFAGGNQVTAITVPGSVNVIEQHAFDGSSSVTSITLSDGTTEIGQYAFSGCDKMTNITLPNTLRIIGSNAFKNWRNMTSITFPDSLTTIGDAAFSGCGALGPEITIPRNVTQIWGNAFTGCTHLKTIRVPYKDSGSIVDAPWGSSAVVRWRDTVITDGWVFQANAKEITNYIGTERNLNMPDEFQTAAGTTVPVQYFSSEMFQKNLNLQSIVIANSISQIPANAFDGCRSLVSVTIPNSVSVIGSFAFRNCSSLPDIVIPDSVTSISQQAFSGCSNLTNVKLSNALTNIDMLLFNSCEKLAEITIPEGVTNISNSAFSNCRSLKTVNLPDGLRSIERGAFLGCSSLKEITIPENVSSIEYDVFSNCPALKKIDISSKPINEIAGAPWGAANAIVFWNDTVQDGDWIFSKQQKIITRYVGNDTDVVMPKTFTYQENGASVTVQVEGFGVSTFEGRATMRSIVITPGITSIPEAAFKNCVSLTAVMIPDSVTSIGESAFYGCKELTGITIPENVTSIRASAFQLCQKLNNVVIPSGVKVIDQYTFAYCSALTNITLPNGLQRIGYSAFFQAYALESITIPETVTSIEKQAFLSCNLRSITIPNSVRSIGDSAFRDCDALTMINIPTKLSGEIPDSPWSAPKAAVVWKDTVLSDGWVFQPGLKRIEQYTGNEVNVVMPSKFTVNGTDIAVESFQPRVFADNQMVESIKLAEGITQIPGMAFASCRSLKSITLGSKVAVMPSNIFAGLTALESIFVRQARTSSPLAPTQPWGAPNSVQVYYSGEFVEFEHTLEKVQGEYKRILKINASADGAIKSITLPDGSVENVGTNNWSAEMAIEENKLYVFKGMNTSGVEYNYEVVVNDIGVPILQSADEIGVNWPSLKNLTKDELVKRTQASSITETGTELPIEISDQDLAAVKAMENDGQEAFITLTTTNPAPWNKTVTKLVKVTLVRSKTDVTFEVNNPGLGSIDKTVSQGIWIGDVLSQNAAIAKVNTRVKNAKFVGWYRVDDPAGPLKYVGDNDKLKEEIVRKAGITYRAVFTTALYESNNLNGPAYGVVVPTYLDVEAGKETDASVQLIQLPNGTNASNDFEPDLKVEVSVETQNSGYLVNPKNVNDKIAYELYYGTYDNAGFKLSEGDTVIKNEKTDTTTFYRKDNGQITADIPGKAYLKGWTSEKGRFVDVLTFKLQRII